MAAYGYAIKNEAGEILVKTIYPRETGAKVNWLHTECGMMTTNGTSDEAINRAFDMMKMEKGVSCVRVEIKEMS